MRAAPNRRICSLGRKQMDSSVTRLPAIKRRVSELVTAFAFALALAAFLGLAIPVYAMPIGGATVMDPGQPQDTKCKPHLGQGLNPHCPPPVVPEAPVAILLPLAAAAVLGAGYFVMRRRDLASTSA